MIRTFVVAMIGVLLISLPAWADVDKFKDCSPAARANINDAVNFLEENIERLRNVEDLGKRKRQERRIRRRMPRKIDDLKVSRTERVMERLSATPVYCLAGPQVLMPGPRRTLPLPTGSKPAGSPSRA
jgi:hypothetical protein